MEEINRKLTVVYNELKESDLVSKAIVDDNTVKVFKDILLKTNRTNSSETVYYAIVQDLIKGAKDSDVIRLFATNNDKVWCILWTNGTIIAKHFGIADKVSIEIKKSEIDIKILPKPIETEVEQQPLGLVADTVEVRKKALERLEKERLEKVNKPILSEQTSPKMNQIEFNEEDYTSMLKKSERRYGRKK